MKSPLTTATLLLSTTLLTPVCLAVPLQGDVATPGHTVRLLEDLDLSNLTSLEQSLSRRNSEPLINGRPPGQYQALVRSLQDVISAKAVSDLRVSSVRGKTPELGGLSVDSESCQGAEYLGLHKAIEGLNLLANAGFNALAPHLTVFSGNPSPFFFRPDQYDRAQGTLALAIMCSAGVDSGKPIRLTCLHPQNRLRCYPPDPSQPRPAAYLSQRNDRNKVIVICPRFHVLPQLGPACSGRFSTDGLSGIGASSQAQTLLQYFMLAIAPNKIFQRALGSRACNGLLNLYTRIPSEIGPLQNADSFARLAGWAWDLGLSATDVVYGPPGFGPLPPPLTCLNWFLPFATKAVGEFPGGLWLSRFAST